MAKITTSASITSVVFIPEGLEKWRKLSDNQSLSMLHAAYWGKSMTEEEAWRVEQRWTSHPSESKGHDADESEDKTGYVLDINSDAIDIKSILVRVSVLTLG
jgi:hypothetical protein